MGCAEVECGQASKCDAMGFKPMKRLLYTWFDNCSVLFGQSELLGHINAMCEWDWSMAFYEFNIGDITIILAFCWCMGRFELN